MSALPPPQPVAQPARRRRFYDGYKAWQWALLIVGALILAIALGPAWWAIFTL